MHHKNESKAALEKLWNVSEGYKSTYEPNVEKGLNKLKAQIAKDRKVATPIKVVALSSKQWGFRIAAAITLLITSGFLFNIYMNDSTSLQEVVTVEELMQDIILPDGSTVAINKYSTLSFPKTFSETERVVILEGEGFFKVVKNTNRPFIVKTKNSEVKVLGTAFNVRAYENEPNTLIEVEEGSVAFNIPALNEERILKANDKIVFNSSDATISEIEALDWQDVAWKSKKLNFDNQPLSEILAYINANFDTKVEFDATKINKCSLSATLVENKPEAILKRVKSAFPLIDLTIINSKLYKLSGNCQ